MDTPFNVPASHPGSEDNIRFIFKGTDEGFGDLCGIRHRLRVENYQQTVCFGGIQAFHRFGIPLCGGVSQDVDGIAPAPMRG